MHVFHSNRDGYLIDPKADFQEPVHPTPAVKTTVAATATDATLTVKANTRYRLVNLGTNPLYLGLADCETDENVGWVVPAGGSIGLLIPLGYTTLHFVGTQSDVFWLIEAKV